MTTPRTPVTSCTEIFILPDSKDEGTTIPVLRAVATEQQAIDLHDSQVTDTLEITKLHSRVEYVETRLERSHVKQTGDRVLLQRVVMTRWDVEALHARDEAIEKRAEVLQISLGATQMDITDLLESRRADRLEMAELWSRVQNIEASL
ncbi:hypothetical protein Tco_1555485 [Tanacetum coccineum]